MGGCFVTKVHKIIFFMSSSINLRVLAECFACSFITNG